MSNYLYHKFYGKYRILVPIDQKTNDFPRSPDGKIETDDFYIPCRKSGKYVAEIYHYGRNILEALVFTTHNPNNYKLIKLCKEKNIPVFDIQEGDGEFSFRFKAEDMEFIAEYLGASTQGKNIRPFSIKNLPQSNYKIPVEDIKKYDAIVKDIPQNERLAIAHITDDFLSKTFDKTLKKRGTNLEKDLKLHKMSRQKKEYIHLNYVWNEYIDYLKKELAND